MQNFVNFFFLYLHCYKKFHSFILKMFIQVFTVFFNVTALGPHYNIFSNFIRTDASGSGSGDVTMFFVDISAFNYEYV